MGSVAGTKLLLLDESFESLSGLPSRHLAEVVRAIPGLTVLVTESDNNLNRLVTVHVYTIERGEIGSGPDGTARATAPARGH